MIKRLLFFLFSLNNIVAFSQQDSTAYEKLLNNCRIIYLNNIGTNSTTFYNGLLRTGKFGLHPEAPFFKAVATELNDHWPGIQGEQVYYKIADSIFTDIRNKYLWSDREIALVQFKPIFELFNEKYCACISEVKVPTENYIAFTRVVGRCDSVLTRDVQLINAIRSKLALLPPAEHAKAQPLLSRYNYQHCPVFREHINASLLEEVQNNVGLYLFMQNYRRPELILGLYQRKSFDSLARLFPQYASFKKDMNAAITPTMKKAETMKRTDRRSQEATTIITTTYYNKGKTTSILGQTICEIHTKNSVEPVVNSYRFIETAKIANKQALLKEIDEEVAMPPPPPQEELLPPPVKKN